MRVAGVGYLTRRQKERLLQAKENVNQDCGTQRRPAVSATPRAQMRETPNIDERDFKAIEDLVDAWCDRRELRALREILSAWPLSSGLTDDYAQLLEALRSLRGVARDALTESELDVIERLIPKVERLVYRR